MKKYSGYLILGNITKSVEIIADSVHPDSTCATRFHKKIKVTGHYGTPETGFELVAQYPSDKLVIYSIKEIEDEEIDL